MKLAESRHEDLYDIALSRQETFFYFFDNILEQNRETEIMPPLLARIEEVLHQFLYRQFKEDASDEQLRVLAAHALKYMGLSSKPPILEGDKTKKYPPLLKIRGLKLRV